MKQYQDMSEKEKRNTLGEVFSLYGLYRDFEMKYLSLPNDLKEMLNKEFEINKPDEVIRTLSIIVSDLYKIAEEHYEKIGQEYTNKGEER